MKLLKIIMTVTIFLCATAEYSYLSNKSDSIAVVPAPQKMSCSSSYHTIYPSTQIVLGKGTDENDRFAAEQITAAIKELTGFTLPILKEEGTPPTRNVIILGRVDTEGMVQNYFSNKGMTLSPEMRAEGYLLDVNNEKTVIGAASPQGTFYGSMTLVQLLRKRKDSLKVHGVTIQDWPDLKIRGYVDDVARGQVSTMEDFKKIIRFVARYKMNMYILYLESDMFQVTKYPIIGKDRGAFTREQVAELASYAKPYHIEIVPCVQTLGHSQNVLHRSEFIHLAEFPAAWTFNVTMDATYKYFEDVLSEVVPAFPGPYFHIACDETVDMGYGASKSLVERLGKARVYADHYKRIYDMVKKYGKEVMMWDDIVLRHPETLSLIPKDVIMVDWHYYASLDYPSIKQVTDAGYRTIVAPGTRNWGSFFPGFYTGFANIKTIIAEGIKGNVLGAVNTNWGDWGEKNFRELTWYANAFAAQCAWNHEKSEVQEFTDRFFLDFFGTNDPALSSIYDLLISIDPGFWSFFEIPFTVDRKMSEGSIVSYTKSQNQTNLVLNLIEKVTPLVTKNKDHLDYLSFIAKSAHWYAKQLYCQALIQNKTAKVTDEELNKNKDEIVKTTSEILEEIKNLRNEYASLWLRTNQQANLHFNLNEYDYLIESWEKKLKQFEEGKYSESLLVPGDWLYHKNATEKTPIPRAFFRKTFFCKPGIKSAQIQTIGDDYIKLYLNGKYVGESVGCWSFSSIVHQQRAKIWDITSLLSEGKNVIAIEAQEMKRDAPNRQGPRNCGGFHLYGEVVTADGSVKNLLSDKTWLCSDLEEDEWYAVDFFDVPWLNVYVDPEPHNKVTYPDFARNKNSWIWPGL